MNAPIPELVNEHPVSYRLPDGRILSAPQPRPHDLLQIRSWVHWDGRPRQIGDLRQRIGGGRLVHLAGLPPEVISLSKSDSIDVFKESDAPLPRATDNA